MSLGIHSEVDSQRSWVDLLLEITLDYCARLHFAEDQNYIKGSGEGRS
jgi:hypothetical protein